MSERDRAMRELRWRLIVEVAVYGLLIVACIAVLILVWR